MNVVERFAKRHMQSRFNHFIEMIRLGWNNYSFIFYIGSISAILGQFFGIAGAIATILTILFFYYAGRVSKVIEKERERERYRKFRNRIRARKKSI